jgi:hypothetical protein
LQLSTSPCLMNGSPRKIKLDREELEWLENDIQSNWHLPHTLKKSLLQRLSEVSQLPLNQENTLVSEQSSISQSSTSNQRYLRNWLDLFRPTLNEPSVFYRTGLRSRSKPNSCSCTMSEVQNSMSLV